MPELPEVETTRLGISQHIHHQKIQAVIIRQDKLRWKVPHEIKNIEGEKLQKITRRGKYLLFHFNPGTLLVHLGMSGSLRVLTKNIPAEKHDHIDLIFANGLCLRFTDPRRFGSWLWTEENPLLHPLLTNLGPEPLTKKFSGEYLYQLSRKRSIAIKKFIMNSHVVVGVGNIYANEALFSAKINPKRSANKMSLKEYDTLAKAIKKILQQAIKQGGTTLRNFMHSEGKPGYFKQRLKVYGRGKLPCTRCKTPLKEFRIGQRSTVYCVNCQQ